MPKHVTYDTNELTLRAEELVSAASNRYKITVQVANRAKRRRYEDFDNDDQVLKPVIRAVLEMSEELTQQDIIGGE
jgi:DNA-directed RNA polymerase subunit omega